MVMTYSGMLKATHSIEAELQALWSQAWKYATMWATGMFWSKVTASLNVGTFHIPSWTTGVFSFKSSSYSIPWIFKFCRRSSNKVADELSKLNPPLPAIYLFISTRYIPQICGSLLYINTRCTLHIHGGYKGNSHPSIPLPRMISPTSSSLPGISWCPSPPLTAQPRSISIHLRRGGRSRCTSRGPGEIYVLCYAFLSVPFCFSLFFPFFLVFWL